MRPQPTRPLQSLADGPVSPKAQTQNEILLSTVAVLALGAIVIEGKTPDNLLVTARTTGIRYRRAHAMINSYQY